ncbi:MFS transporter [Streptomyces collinus]|uniref:MFS transporter n=1 Tax=Streptomyces collinus TaxID=42684 RepID=UPI0036C75F1E
MRSASYGYFRLPRAAWIILGGELVNAIGSGATIPFMLVYLVEVCNVNASSAAALMLIRALLGFSGALIAGPLVDRFGPKVIAAASLTLASIGSVGLFLASDALSGIIAATACTMATIICQPALDSLLSIIVSASRRQTAFAWRQTFVNAGGAAGAALAAAAVSWWSAAAGLKWIYLFDSFTFIVYALILLMFISVAYAPKITASQGLAEAGLVKSSYRHVWRDASMRWLCVTLALVTAAGFAQLEVGLPALVALQTDDVDSLGWMMAANMITILALQLPIQRALAGRRRSSALALALLLFASTWIILLLAGIGLTSLICVGALFGVAETLFTPVVSALVNDLSPSNMRGRYNSAQLSCWTGGWMVGAMAATGFFATGQASGQVLFISCIGALLMGIISLGMLRNSTPPHLINSSAPVND